MTLVDQAHTILLSLPSSTHISPFPSSSALPSSPSLPRPPRRQRQQASSKPQDGPLTPLTALLDPSTTTVPFASSSSSSPPPHSASSAAWLPKSVGPPRSGMLVALFLFTLSLGLIPTAEAQAPGDVTFATSQSSSQSSYPRGYPTHSNTVEERDFHPTRLHAAKVREILRLDGNSPEMTKASAQPSAPYPRNTSAAVFASRQYNSKLSSSSRLSRDCIISSSRTATSTEQSQPRLAFAYLEEMGLESKVPFKSSMNRVGESWNEAGLRSNVDPRLPSVYRSQLAQTQLSAKTKARERDLDDFAEDEQWGGTRKAQGWRQKEDISRPRFEQQQQKEKGEQQDRFESSFSSLFDRTKTSNGQISYAEKVAAKQKLSSSGFETGRAESMASTSREGDAEENEKAANDINLLDTLPTSSGAGGATGSVSPEVMMWSGFFISSGRMMVSWLRKGQPKDDSGIALTMLRPKVQRPVIGRLPLIPNDSKRDFVWLILVCLALCCALCILWTSRVTPEEYERMRRLKEYAANAAAKVQTDAMYEDHEEHHIPTGLSSSSRPASGYSRSRAGVSTMSRRARMAGGGDDTPATTGGQSGDSEGEYLHLGMDRRHAALQASRESRRGSLLGSRASLGPSAHRERSVGFLSTFLPSLLRWYRRRNSNPEAFLPLPLSADLGRSSTPNSFLHAVTAPGSDSILFPLISGRRSRSNSITAKRKQQNSTTLLPSSILDSRTSSTSSLQSVAQKVPFRSITPQPHSTSTQKQREREKRRMTILEAGRKDEAASSARALAHAGYETLDQIENGQGYGLEIGSGSGSGRIYDTRDLTTIASISGSTSGSGSASGSVSGGDDFSRPASVNSYRTRWEGVSSGVPTVAVFSAATLAVSASAVVKMPSAPHSHGMPIEASTSSILAPPLPSSSSSSSSLSRPHSPQRVGSGESTPRASEIYHRGETAVGSGAGGGARRTPGATTTSADSDGIETTSSDPPVTVHKTQSQRRKRSMDEKQQQHPSRGKSQVISSSFSNGNASTAAAPADNDDDDDETPPPPDPLLLPADRPLSPSQFRGRGTGTGTLTLTDPPVPPPPSSPGSGSGTGSGSSSKGKGRQMENGTR